MNSTRYDTYCTRYPDEFRHQVASGDGQEGAGASHRFIATGWTSASPPPSHHVYPHTVSRTYCPALLSSHHVRTCVFFSRTVGPSPSERCRRPGKYGTAFATQTRPARCLPTPSAPRLLLRSSSRRKQFFALEPRSRQKPLAQPPLGPRGSRAPTSPWRTIRTIRVRPGPAPSSCVAVSAAARRRWSSDSLALRWSASSVPSSRCRSAVTAERKDHVRTPLTIDLASTFLFLDRRLDRAPVDPFR